MFLSRVPKIIPGTSGVNHGTYGSGEDGNVVNFDTITLKSAETIKYKTSATLLVDTTFDSLTDDLGPHILTPIALIGTSGGTKYLGETGSGGGNYTVDEDRHNIALSDPLASRDAVLVYTEWPDYWTFDGGHDFAVKSLSGPKTKTSDFEVLFAYKITVA
jgi:hypothetical protein